MARLRIPEVVPSSEKDCEKLHRAFEVCGAPKRRFRSYVPEVSKGANDTVVRKARKEQMKRDEVVGQALPCAIALGVAALATLYFYLNSTY